MRFNPPPNWPTPPPGWTPPEGWQPDPAWGPPPPGWQLWVDDAEVTQVASQPTMVQQYPSGYWQGGTPSTPSKSRRGLLIGAAVGVVVLVGAIVAGVLLLGKDSAKSDEDRISDLVYALADAYNDADASAFNDLLCEADRFEQTDDQIRDDIADDGEVTIESVEKVEIDGELATAHVTSREANKDESDTDTFEFKLIDGEWFVCDH